MARDHSRPFNFFTKVQGWGAQARKSVDCGFIIKGVFYCSLEIYFTDGLFMKRYTTVLLTCFVVLLMSLAVMAQDAPADGSPADNACFEGGSLAGKCDWPTAAERDWAWTCGWYIARVESGELAPSDVPAWCFYTMTADGGSGTYVVGKCYSIPGRADFRTIKPPNTLDNIEFYHSEGGVCDGAPISLPHFIVIHTSGDNTQAGYDASCAAVKSTIGMNFPHSYQGEIWLLCSSI